MTVVTYQSTDTGAPTLQGVVGGAFSSGWADGSFLQLLYKCLVVGYGSKPAAGWTLPFNGTSKGVFKLGGGTGFYFRVLDDGSLTAGAREAEIYGGVTASDVDTLTGLFPTAAQQAAGIKFRKSNAASATQRPWVVYADNKTAIVFAWSNFGDGATDYLTAIYIGDFFSFHTNDAYNSCLISRVTSAAVDAPANENLDAIGASTGELTSKPGHYFAGPYSQLAQSVNFGKTAGFITTSTATLPIGGGAQLAFPNPTDVKFWLSRLYVTDPTTSPATSLRGYLRGLWGPMHAVASLPKEYTFVGTGSLLGRTFKNLGLGGGGAGAGAGLSVYCVETSNTWD